ncbi:hypothetical protein CDIK_2799 [Cucumispora dikerogammari]|nr:hypothetical protein CDIK_2799 [Cucumispora dikerogammari]
MYLILVKYPLGDTITLDSRSSITQLKTSIAYRSNDDSGAWCSSFFTSPPEKFCCLAGMKVKLSTTIEGFFELFFTNKILDFIYTLKIKKQKEDNKRKTIVSLLISKYLNKKSKHLF